MAQPFGMGLGMSPMYPGMMGGVHGMAIPQPGMMVVGPPHRRRLAQTDDVITPFGKQTMMALRKCALMVDDGTEICVIHDLVNGDVSLEFNRIKRSDVADEIGDWNRMQSMLETTEYLEQWNWIWSGNEGENDCNSQLLSGIGRTVCIRNVEDSVFAEIVDIAGDDAMMRLHFDNDHEEDWSAIYHLNENGGERICRYVLSNDLCIERLGENQFVITVERSNLRRG